MDMWMLILIGLAAVLVVILVVARARRGHRASPNIPTQSRASRNVDTERPRLGNPPVAGSPPPKQSSPRAYSPTGPSSAASAPRPRPSAPPNDSDLDPDLLAELPPSAAAPPYRPSEFGQIPSQANSIPMPAAPWSGRDEEKPSYRPVARSKLPHNGLFIRRHNSYGTRATSSIKDLIDNGVFVEQNNIRFDDFLPAAAEQVPSPPPGQAIAISYGVSPIPGALRYHEQATHYLELALRCADPSAITPSSRTRTPVNYIFVVDTSGSMRGEKLESVKGSIRQLFQLLGDDDVLGLVTFNDSVRTVLKAIPKAKLSTTQLATLVAELQAHGSTDLNLGLQYGLDELERYGQAGLLNQIYLFSDGNPNSGEMNWLTIRSNLAARARTGLSVTTFAFGSDANLGELDRLAGVAGGKSIFITSPDDITVNLREDLVRRDYLAGINIQLQIEFDLGLDILYLFGHDLITDPAQKAAVLRDVDRARALARERYQIEAAPDIVTQEQGVRIFVPNLALGDTYWIVFELKLPLNLAQAALARARIQYVDVLQHAPVVEELAISAPGVIDPGLVTLHGLGLRTSEAAFFALDDLYAQNFEAARNGIERHISVLELASRVVPDASLRDDMIALRKFVSLANNLGKIRRMSDSAHEPYSFTTYTLNNFAQSKNGFLRAFHRG